MSAYEVWLSQGNTGTEQDFLNGITGPQGPAGSNGVNGATGPAGTDGNGIASTTDNGDGTITFTYDDGTTSTVNIEDADSDSTNELQTLSLSNDTLFLTNGNSVSLTNISTVQEGVKIGFSASTSWTCPSGINQITVELWGGAGGGGSSSGWAYYWNGLKCYKNFYNYAGNGGWGGYGEKGGEGGNGGYNKMVIAVTPGQIYNISIGTGGSGGIGGCPIGVNGGSDGLDGGNTTIEIGGNILLSAEGGLGGEKGVVNCGCPGAPSGGSSGNCPGWVSGSAGNDGQIINYTPAVSTPNLPSYIPFDYLSSTPDCCADGGAFGTLGSYNSGAGLGDGGNSGGGCGIVWVTDNNYPRLERGAAPGQDGENGFCVISY